jgi:predicted site-specific integrase-resolvase
MLRSNLLALAGVMLARVCTVEEFSIEQLDSDHSKNELGEVIVSYIENCCSRVYQEQLDAK